MQTAPVYSYPGTGTQAIPTGSTLPGGSGVTIQCYLTGITAADGSDAADSDPYWDQVDSTALPGITGGNVAVVPDSSLSIGAGTPVTQLVPPCAAGGSAGNAPAAADPAAAPQGGCQPYQLQADNYGSFSMSVCVSDNGTGTTAYPSVTVDQVPAFRGTSCTIAIELWDDNEQSYGKPGQADCTEGDYQGNSFGPVDAPLTLHAFARLKICTLTVCNSYFLGNGQGDSPSITLQPFVKGKSAKKATQKQPYTPLLPLNVGNGQNEGGDCLNNRFSPPGSYVERNGNGWNRYTVTHTDKGDRPSTATACLDATLIKGTTPMAWPFGMDDAIAKVNAWKTSLNLNIRPTKEVARCHLIAGGASLRYAADPAIVPGTPSAGGSLGGNGTIASNLVPCWQRTTNIGMLGYENTISKELATLTVPGSAIYYNVTPDYRDDPSTGTSTIPVSITLSAYIQIPGESVSTLIPPTTISNVWQDFLTNDQALQLGN